MLDVTLLANVSDIIGAFASVLTLALMIATR